LKEGIPLPPDLFLHAKPASCHQYGD